MEKTHAAEQEEQGAKNTHGNQCTYRQPLASPKTPGAKGKEQNYESQNPC